MSIKKVLMTLAVVGAVFGGTSKDAQAQPVAASYYSPRKYMGRVVYFDAKGRPMYCNNGVRYYVPSNTAAYSRLVAHYSSMYPAYMRWFGQIGYTYFNNCNLMSVSGYVPQYYDGYVVYYDNSGRPFYYYNGSMVYVPATYSGYRNYVRYWRRNRRYYRRWRKRYGRRYRTYRSSRYRLKRAARRRAIRNRRVRRKVRRNIRAARRRVDRARRRVNRNRRRIERQHRKNVRAHRRRNRAHRRNNRVRRRNNRVKRERRKRRNKQRNRRRNRRDKRRDRRTRRHRRTR